MKVIVRFTCQCPKGHIIQSSLIKEDLNIEYERVNKNLVGQKIFDFCKQCGRIEVLRVVDIISFDKE